MPRPRDNDRFYKDFREYGLELTLKERDNGRIYVTGTVEGERIRRSTKTDDPELAEQRGRELAREIVLQLLTGGGPTPSLTIGEVLTKWRELKKSSYEGTRPRILDQRASFLESLWGSTVPVSYLDQDDVDEARDEVLGREDVESRTTARHYLNAISTIFNWATRKKIEGDPLLEENPLSDLRFPARSESGARPVASHTRFLRTLRHAHRASPSQPGALVTALVVARYQGRRKTSIRQLRDGDVCLAASELRQLLSDIGGPPSIANHWPHGAILWRAESDKQDRRQLVPLHPAAARALRYHRRRMRRQGVTSYWLFPSPKGGDGPVDNSTFDDWLRDAEHLARLAGEDVLDLNGGLWHPYRRLWRAERRRFHEKGVAYLGGWKYGARRDVSTMNRGYLPIPAPDLQEIVNASPAPHRRTLDTADRHRGDVTHWEGRV